MPAGRDDVGGTAAIPGPRSAAVGRWADNPMVPALTGLAVTVVGLLGLRRAAGRHPKVPEGFGDPFR